jgi:hypothetical protein
VQILAQEVDLHVDEPAESVGAGVGPFSGAKTSILTGLARCDAPVELADDRLALAADVTARAVPTVTTTAVAAKMTRLFLFIRCPLAP